MGSLFKSKTTATKSPFETNPWEPQQQYLKDGFKQGGAALDGALAQSGQITDFTADMNAGQTADINSIQNFGRDTVGGVAQAGIDTGMSAVGNFGQAGQNYGQLYGMASQDPTQGIIGNAQAYANDPYLQGQIDSALGDVNKAFQGQVGEINSGAAATGNINSTRAGALESNARDDAMDRGAQISSQMRGQAYQSGLDRSMTTQQNQFANMMGANGAMEQNGQAGFNMASSGAAVGMGGLQDSLAAGGALQQQAQSEINGKRDMSREQMDLISKYMSIVGGNYGQKGYTTTISKDPSIFQQVAGAAATYAGAGGSFCWVAREVYGEDDPRWQDFRFWMFTKAPDWFFHLYGKHGEKASIFIRRHPWLKSLIRPLMNLAIK